MTGQQAIFREDKIGETELRIWLDADATPRDVKDIVFRAAHRLAVKIVVVANQRVPIPPGHTMISAVRVEGGPDAADRYIAESAAAGDVAITSDIPLAAILVAAIVVHRHRSNLKRVFAGIERRLGQSA